MDYKCGDLIFYEDDTIKYYGYIFDIKEDYLIIDVVYCENDEFKTDMKMIMLPNDKVTVWKSVKELLVHINKDELKSALDLVKFDAELKNNNFTITKNELQDSDTSKNEEFENKLTETMVETIKLNQEFLENSKKLCSILENMLDNNKD